MSSGNLLPKRVLYLVTVSNSLQFIEGKVEYLQNAGYEVGAITASDSALEEFGARNRCYVASVAFSRRISPIKDIRVVFELIREIRRFSPSIVHAMTPKAGLLGMVAGRIAGVPITIYDIYGFPFETTRGLRKVLLKGTEKVACGLAHQVLAVSPSLEKLAVAEGIVAADRVKTLHNGSSHGVDAESGFNPDLYRGRSEKLRQGFGIPSDGLVVTFAGRLARDKGLAELINAWESVRGRVPKAYLLLAGGIDQRDPANLPAIHSLENDERVVMLGTVPKHRMVEVYAVSDLLVLPTYREGMPNVLLEAAAMSVPVVATSVTGCVDVVDDGETGRLVPPRDAQALADAIIAYLECESERVRVGNNARHHVLEKYQPVDLLQALQDEYSRQWRMKAARNRR